MFILTDIKPSKPSLQWLGFFIVFLSVTRLIELLFAPLKLYLKHCKGGMLMNLFDGIDSHSDGTNNGPSESIVGDGANVNIYVGGAFDTARVVMQKYSTTRQDFYPTEAVWTTQNEFVSLYAKVGDIYRLFIEGAGAGTDLFAEVS